MCPLLAGALAHGQHAGWWTILFVFGGLVYGIVTGGACGSLTIRIEHRGGDNFKRWTDWLVLACSLFVPILFVFGALAPMGCLILLILGQPITGWAACRVAQQNEEGRRPCRPEPPTGNVCPPLDPLSRRAWRMSKRMAILRPTRPSPRAPSKMVPLPEGEGSGVGRQVHLPAPRAGRSSPGPPSAGSISAGLSSSFSAQPLLVLRLLFGREHGENILDRLLPRLLGLFGQLPSTSPAALPASGCEGCRRLASDSLRCLARSA